LQIIQSRITLNMHWIRALVFVSLMLKEVSVWDFLITIGEITTIMEVAIGVIKMAEVDKSTGIIHQKTITATHWMFREIIITTTRITITIITSRVVNIIKVETVAALRGFWKRVIAMNNNSLTIHQLIIKSKMGVVHPFLLLYKIKLILC